MARTLFSTVVAGTVVWLLAGGMLNTTAAVNEGMLRMGGGLLGAITGAVIGGVADIIAAIDRSRSPAADGASRLTPPGRASSGAGG